MSELRVYITSAWRDADSICPWAVLDDQGALQQYGEATFAHMPKGYDCHVVVAADRVLSVAAALPPGGRGRWQKILPFVVEEFSLADPEDNHVVPGAVLADGRHQLYVMDRTWLKRIVSAAQQAGISLRSLVSETFLLQTDEKHWTVVWDGAGGFVATGDNRGVALDAGEATAAPLALKLALANAPQMPQNIQLRGMQDATGKPQALPQWQDMQVPVLEGAVWDWRRQPRPAAALNMLWGEFTPRAKIRGWWPGIRPAIMLLLAIFVLEVAGSNLQWVRLLIQQNGLNLEMQKTFRRTFGDDVTLVNAPLQMQRNLASLRHAAGVPDAGDFLPLLNRASPVLSVLPAGSLAGMHYESGRLDFDVRLPRRDGLAILKQGLQESGLAVRQGELHDLGNGIAARITVMPEGMQ